MKTAKIELFLGIGCAIVAGALALTHGLGGQGVQPSAAAETALAHAAPNRNDRPLDGTAGASAGHIKAPPAAVRAYVTTQVAEPAGYAGPVDIGERLDGNVAWRDVPGHPGYHWARLNDERVVVDDRRRVAAIYIN